MKQNEGKNTTMKEIKICQKGKKKGKFIQKDQLFTEEASMIDTIPIN